MTQPNPSKPAALAQTQALSYAYPQHVVFDGLSLQIPPGVSLLAGDEGCGKTTLMRLLGAEFKAAVGRLQVNGVWLDEQPQAYAREVFWVDPRTEVFNDISALTWWDSLRPRYPHFDEQGVLDDLIDGLTLAEHQAKPMYMLSTGSRRKVWLAGALASGAALTLLDEPLAALDKPSIRFVLELLADAAQQPSRAFLVAHYEALPGVPLASVIELG